MWTKEDILRGVKLHQEGLRRIADAYGGEPGRQPLVYTSEQYFQGQAIALQFILSLYGEEK